MLFTSVPAVAQTHKDPAVTVVIPVDVREGVSTDRAVAAMKEIAGFIRAQPGLVSEQIMIADNPGVPKYLHVMRWRSLSDWMALSASGKFQQLLTRDLPFVKIQLAQPYRPLP